MDGELRASGSSVSITLQPPQLVLPYPSTLIPAGCDRLLVTLTPRFVRWSTIQTQRMYRERRHRRWRRRHHRFRFGRSSSSTSRRRVASCRRCRRLHQQPPPPPSAQQHHGRPPITTEPQSTRTLPAHATRDVGRLELSRTRLPDRVVLSRLLPPRDKASSSSSSSNSYLQASRRGVVVAVTIDLRA